MRSYAAVIGLLCVCVFRSCSATPTFGLPAHSLPKTKSYLSPTGVGWNGYSNNGGHPGSGGNADVGPHSDITTHRLQSSVVGGGATAEGCAGHATEGVGSSFGNSFGATLEELDSTFEDSAEQTFGRVGSSSGKTVGHAFGGLNSGFANTAGQLSRGVDSEVGNTAEQTFGGVGSTQKKTVGRTFGGFGSTHTNTAGQVFGEVGSATGDNAEQAFEGADSTIGETTRHGKTVGHTFEGLSSLEKSTKQVFGGMDSATGDTADRPFGGISSKYGKTVGHAFGGLDSSHSNTAGEVFEGVGSTLTNSASHISPSGGNGGMDKYVDQVGHVVLSGNNEKSSSLFASSGGQGSTTGLSGNLNYAAFGDISDDQQSSESDGSFSFGYLPTSSTGNSEAQASRIRALEFQLAKCRRAKAVLADILIPIIQET